MAAKFSIWIVSPSGHLHHRAFEEVALALREAFGVLGYDVPVVTDPDLIVGRPIVLGGLYLTRLRFPPHQSPVIYNMEQASEDSHVFTETYRALLRDNTTWDYSENNVEVLRSMGIRATLCGVGYVPGLTRIAHPPEKDIDVAFVGQFHERRNAVLTNLFDAGVKVVAIGGNCYGAERDQVYARSKIVLNIHMLSARVMQIVRISYLLANRICVVSETGSDAALERPFHRGVAFADYEDLSATCMRLLADPDERDRIANTGFKIFSEMSQVEMLQAALATLDQTAPNLGEGVSYLRP